MAAAPLPGHCDTLLGGTADPWDYEQPFTLSWGCSSESPVQLCSQCRGKACSRLCRPIGVAVLLFTFVGCLLFGGVLVGTNDKVLAKGVGGALLGVSALALVAGITLCVRIVKDAPKGGRAVLVDAVPELLQLKAVQYKSGGGKRQLVIGGRPLLVLDRMGNAVPVPVPV